GQIRQQRINHRPLPVCGIGRIPPHPPSRVSTVRGLQAATRLPEATATAGYGTITTGTPGRTATLAPLALPGAPLSPAATRRTKIIFNQDHPTAPPSSGTGSDSIRTQSTVSTLANSGLSRPGQGSPGTPYAGALCGSIPRV